MRIPTIRSAQGSTMVTVNHAVLVRESTHPPRRR